MSRAESRDGRVEGGQNRVHGCEDGATVSVGHQRVGDSSDDADCGLGTHLQQSLIDGADAEVVDDLGSLHGLTGGDV